MRFLLRVYCFACMIEIMRGERPISDDGQGAAFLTVEDTHCH